MQSPAFAALRCGLTLVLLGSLALGCGGGGSEGAGGAPAASTGGVAGSGGASDRGGVGGTSAGGESGAGGRTTDAGGRPGSGGATPAVGGAGSGGAPGTGGVSATGGASATGAPVGGAAGRAAGGATGTGGQVVGSGGVASGGSPGACVPPSPNGGCGRDGDLFCGGTVCCPSTIPFYCQATNYCYPTAQQAASACAGGTCSACIVPMTGTCPSAPSGGACNGIASGHFYCGVDGCCDSDSPYYCPSKKLCYKTSNQAFGACGGDSCVACTAPCSAPPNLTSSDISDGLCGGKPLAMIDGIPAFAMCDAALNSNVWSSTGGNTAGVSEGPGWVETGAGRISGQNGYQCTELAMRYFYFHFGICPWNGVPAKDMCSEALPSTVVIRTTPVHGDLIVLPPGCNGAGQDTGHVAVVDTVNGSTVTVVQENSGAYGTGTLHTDCATCFLHAVANQVSP